MAIKSYCQIVNLQVPAGQGKRFIILLLARYFAKQCIETVDIVAIFCKDEVTFNQFREYQDRYLEGEELIEVNQGAEFEEFNHYLKPLFLLDECDVFYEQDLARFPGTPKSDPVLGGIISLTGKVVGLSATWDPRNG